MTMTKTPASVGPRVAVLAAAVAIASLIATILPGTTADAKRSLQHPPLTGIVTVIDGDTIRMNDQDIRLWGMDAPEEGRTCTRPDGTTVNVSQTAKAALVSLIGGRPVRCEYRNTDTRYNRPVDVCSVAGTDLGGAMVEQGHARDWPRYSGGFYAGHEQRARAVGSGVWAMSCTNLWSGRRLK